MVSQRGGQESVDKGKGFALYLQEDEKPPEGLKQGSNMT